MSETHTSFEYQKQPLPAKWQTIGWTCIAIGVALAALSYFGDRPRMLFNDLIGLTFLMSVAVGAIFFVALEYFVGAVWSTPFRRVTEFLGAILPYATVLALPIVAYAHDVFHWTHHDVVMADEILRGKASYLNMKFFTGRFISVLLVWFVYYSIVTYNSYKQDKTQDQKHTRLNVKLSTIFIPLFAISITMFSVDWIMSLEPHWFSTMFGVYYFSGTALTSLAVITFFVVTLGERGYFSFKITPDHYYSFGAFLFAFTCFWAYIAFCQFLLIWYANIPEETFWYMARWKGGWEYVGVLLILVRFWIPFFALSSRSSKMNLKRLKTMSVWIAASHFIDLYWLIMPTHYKTVSLGWQEFVFPIISFGIIVLVFFNEAKKKNLVPIGDPKLQRGIDFRL